MASIYDFKVADKKGNEVSLADYKGKTLLIVNIATKCGFTPQLEALEALYTKYRAQGLEILAFPCNQFGEQAPGSDEEIQEFCTLKFGTKFPQFRKADVNGPAQLPLFQWLKESLPFKGLDPEHEITPILEPILDKTVPDWRETPEVKWNFTKFLVSADGQPLARFEPTRDMAQVEAAIAAALPN